MLAQPADHPHDRAVRWRQLVELLARGSGAGDPAAFGEALAVVTGDSPLVEEEVRMAAARAIAPLAAPPELVRAFAADRLSVAAPVLAAARLTASDWAEVAAGASPECRRFIASLRPDLPAETATPEPTPEPPAPAATPEPPAPAPGSEPPAAAPPPSAEPEPPIPSISEVVARIERLRHARQQAAAEMAPAPPPQASEPPRLFRWECDEAGEIAWVDGAPRGAVIGRSIARGGEGGDIDRSVERAFALRVPFSDARLELAEGSTVGGSWKISGMPAFDASSGRFSGYRGIAEREGAAGAAEQPFFAASDPDSVRELVHELKTPLNAIIGFAEIISSEYLGPAAKPYRERAGEIVAQAQLLLTAIDDLDFAARRHAQRGSAVSTSLAEAADRVAAELGEAGASFEISAPAATSLDPALADRLLARFCRAVLAQAGKPQTFTIDQRRNQCIVSAPNPGVGRDAETSLALRLVLGLARVAGGDLDIGRDRIKLLLPKA